ncbi:MAG: hypothetical protein AAGA10_17525 [Bacteroidota bacterium]
MKRTVNHLRLCLLFLLPIGINSGCALELLSPNNEETAAEEGDKILGDWELLRINGQRGPWNITTGDGQRIQIDQIALTFEEGSYVQTLVAGGERGAAEGTWIWLEEGKELSLDNTDYTIMQLSNATLEMESETGAVFEYDRD